MKVAILGAKGQLGTLLSKALSNSTDTLLQLSREECNIQVSSQIEKLFVEFQPDIVINSAALTNVNAIETNDSMAIDINGKALRNISTNCHRHGARLIHISTDFVFDGLNSNEMSFDSKTNPISKYGLTKLMGEEEIASGLTKNFTILRVGSLYGGHQNNFVTYLLENLRQGKKVKLARNQWIQPTNAFHVSEFISSLIHQKVDLGIYHATSTGLVSKVDFATAISNALNFPTNLIEPIDFFELPGHEIRPQFSNLVEKRSSLFGLQQSASWEEQLEDFARFQYQV